LIALESAWFEPFMGLWSDRLVSTLETYEEISWLQAVAFKWVNLYHYSTLNCPEGEAEEGAAEPLPEEGGGDAIGSAALTQTGLAEGAGGVGGGVGGVGGIGGAVHVEFM
jgi:hypothetical protein